MRLYSIDTSAWIAFFRNRPAKVAQRVNDVLLDQEAAILIDGIVLAELLQGVKTSTEKKVVAEQLRSLKNFPLNRGVFELAGNLNNKLRRRGLTLPLTDALIAATAITYKATILTLDDHFKHFTGLKIELIK